MRNLTITLVQQDLIWEQPAANREHLQRLLEGQGQTDLIVLPEMFSTGFTMRAEELAEEPEGPTLHWMKSLAAQYDAAVTGSLIVKEHGKYFNRLYWVTPDGVARSYDKRHLFSLAGEEKVFSPGQQRLVVNWREWRICPVVCYDLRFPVWSRNTEQFDLLLYVANWPEKRSYPWNTLLKARAIENLCWVAGINRTGTDGNNEAYAGDSQLIDPLGQVVMAAGSKVGVYTYEMSGSLVTETRNRFSFLNDRDDFTLQQ